MQEKKVKVITKKSEYFLALFLFVFGSIWAFVSSSFFLIGPWSLSFISIFLFLFISPFLIIGTAILSFSLFLFLGYLKIYQHEDQALINYSLFGINVASNYYSNIKEFEFKEDFPKLYYPVSTLLVSNSDEKEKLNYISNISELFNKKLISRNYFDNAIELMVVTLLKLLSQKTIKLTTFNKKFLLLGNEISKLNYFTKKVNNNDFMILSFDEEYIPQDYIEECMINILKNKESLRISENPIFINIQYVLDSVFPRTENNPKKWLCDKLRKTQEDKGFFESKEVELKLAFFKTKDIQYSLKYTYEEEFESQRELIFNYLNKVIEKYPELFDLIIKKAESTINKKTTSSD